MASDLVVGDLDLFVFGDLGGDELEFDRFLRGLRCVGEYLVLFFLEYGGGNAARLVLSNDIVDGRVRFLVNGRRRCV